MKSVFFDLDGTLLDPKAGIITCLQHALSKFGIKPPPDDQLLWCIGPPLRESFKVLLPDPSADNVEKAVSYYRERYSVAGLYENTIYEGVPEMLAEVKANRRVFLATSKPRVYAEKIAEHFGFSKFIEKVYGAELDGRYDNKGELLAHLLKQEGISPH